ncbi:MAG: alpha/beta hydrolase [Oleiphilus sp.]
MPSSYSSHTNTIRLILTTLMSSLLIMTMSGCATSTQRAATFHQSEHYYNYLQPSLEQYISETRRWLSQHRDFISEDHARELQMNSPFFLHSAENTHVIMLIHGLGDSPFYFRDIADSLHQQGYDVLSILLPGHGSKPSDLLKPHYEDWQNMVDFYAFQLKQRYANVWLGGFSTGANLATTHALVHEDIQGLLLFSPGFQTHLPFLEKLTPMIATFKDWGWQTKEDNLARYSSSPLNATIAYSDSAEVVRDLLKKKDLTIPTFIAMSEKDSVIDAEAIKTLFLEAMPNPNNVFIMYGETEHSENRFKTKSMRLPELRISTGSHMSPLFSPDNPYYGQHGEKRICRNGLSPRAKAHCLSNQEIWFSAWGHYESDKVHARLTWNPHFDDLLENLSQFVTTPARSDSTNNALRLSERREEKQKNHDQHLVPDSSHL